MRVFTSLSLVTLAAAGLAMPALAAPPMAGDPDTAALVPAKFLAKAGASDKFEIAEAQMMTSSANPDVKSFAQKMIADHMKSTGMVKAAARKDGLTPKPAMLLPKQMKLMAALRAAHGTARDTLYVQQQLPAHQEALALHQSEATSGPTAALKQTSAQIVPVVQSHLDMLNQMNSTKTGM